MSSVTRIVTLNSWNFARFQAKVHSNILIVRTHIINLIKDQVSIIFFTCKWSRKASYSIVVSLWNTILIEVSLKHQALPEQKCLTQNYQAEVSLLFLSVCINKLLTFLDNRLGSLHGWGSFLKSSLNAPCLACSSHLRWSDTESCGSFSWMLELSPTSSF